VRDAGDARLAAELSSDHVEVQETRGLLAGQAGPSLTASRYAVLDQTEPAARRTPRGRAPREVRRRLAGCSTVPTESRTRWSVSWPRTPGSPSSAFGPSVVPSSSMTL
jgi:hypothetical protein